MIKLYGGDKQFSSWSMRAFILLEESKIDYEYTLIGLDWPVKYHTDGRIEILTGENDYDIPEEPASGCACQLTQIIINDSTNLIKKSFTELLPRVPILVDTEKEVVISDILVMEDYLRNNYGVNLLSNIIKTKYEILTFCSHIHADLLPLMSEMSYSNSFRNPNKKDIGGSGITQLNETLMLIESILSKYEKRFLFENRITFADIMFAPIAQQIQGWKINIGNTRVENYISLLLNHHSIKNYILDAQQFYINIEKAKKDSPKWIVSHYRYHPKLKMLNNPKYDVYHILDNDISELLYNLALKNKSKAEIVDFITDKFQIDKEIVTRDVEEFFEKIHPNTMYSGKLKNAQ